MTYYNSYPSSWYPKIVSNGGGSSATIHVMENTSFVTDVETWDNVSTEENGRLTYKIVGGADRDLFKIDRRTGVLEFKDEPDFENPTDYGRNNVYDVVVKVIDGIGLSDKQRLWVKVTDKPEPVDSDPNKIDFETDGDGNALSKGQIIDDEFAALGITVTTDDPVNHPAMIFDSANPTGGDFDLATSNQGKILIISEDGDSSDPDDNRHGGTLIFNFDSPRSIEALGLLDTEEPGGEIRTYDAAGNLISVTAIPTIANGASQTVQVGDTDVSRMEVHLSGSGAITHLCFEPAALGDFVFNDTDGDGIQDANESGVAGVTVTLTGGGEDGVIGTADDTTANTVTDANGFYQFDNLNPGEEYKVTFSDLPDGFEFTTANAGNNDAVDSDANPLTGMTEIVTLAPGENNPTLDAGIVAQRASLGDKVFNDLDGDGIQDGNEPGVDGIKVTLTGGGADGVIGTTDDTTQMTTTANGGMYGFDNLNPGEEYKVTFSDLPNGFEFTTPNAGNNDAVDSDANPNTGMTEIVTLAPGENNPTLDAGLIEIIKPASLGDKVFNDADSDGIQDPGEVGVDGVKVTLTGGGADGIIGTADDTTDMTTTANGGMYGFNNLNPGEEYKVTFSDLPNGFEFTTPNVGGNDAVDSDADPSTGMTPIVTLASGENNTTLDAGIIEIVPPKVDISGTDGPDTLDGTDLDENIFGFDGKDVINGNGGDDCLFGGAESDTVTGGDGDDTINGTDSIAIGFHEEDIVTGGAGADRFIAGDADNFYYIGNGNDDCVVVNDFNTVEDILQLHGAASNYQAAELNGDTFIYKTLDGGGFDLVALLKGVNETDLNSSFYDYV